MNIKNVFFVALASFCLGGLSCYAQASRNSDDADAKEEKSIESSTGASFVACSSGGASIPSTLYVRAGKSDFVEFKLPPRSASIRLAFPSDGVYNFWLSDPTGSVSSDEKGRRAKVAIPEPDIQIAVPEGLTGRVICLLQAREGEGGKLQIVPTCIPDDAIPKTGQTVLNLSPYNLVVATATKGDFSDKQQIKIAPCANMKSIDSSNICVVPGEQGQRIHYMVSATLPDYEGLSRIKSSTMVISKTQMQLNVVVKELDKNNVTVETVQARAVKKRKTSRTRTSR